MLRVFRHLRFIVVVCSLSTTAAIAQSGQQVDPEKGDNAGTYSQQDMLKIAKEVQHRLRSLTNYSVFDSLSFGVRGRTVVLEGYASRPILKSDAESAVKSIPGIESVENQIKVLPNSPMDDRIRAAVYRRIYSQPALRKYTGSSVGFGRFPSVARAAGGITQDPPLGFNAIHIIVDSGHVTLTGVVDSESDATIANMQANLTPGVFSVDNALQIAGRPAKVTATAK